MLQKKSRGLYWIDGMVPTQTDRDAAAALGITAFRNAQLAGDSGLEPTELVAGCAPEGYSRMPGCRVLTAENVATRMEREAKRKAAEAK